MFLKAFFYRKGGLKSQGGDYLLVKSCEVPSLPSLATNFSSGSQTVRVRCMLPDFNFFFAN